MNVWISFVEMNNESNKVFLADSGSYMVGHTYGSFLDILFTLDMRIVSISSIVNLLVSECQLTHSIFAPIWHEVGNSPAWL